MTCLSIIQSNHNLGLTDLVQKFSTTSQNRVSMLSLPSRTAALGNSIVQLLHRRFSHVGFWVFRKRDAGAFCRVADRSVKFLVRDLFVPVLMRHTDL